MRRIVTDHLRRSVASVKIRGSFPPNAACSELHSKRRRTEMSLGNKQVVSREEWIEARRAFLAKEKEFTRQRDELSRRRRDLPWVKVEENYVFDGPKGKATLADLFDGRSQLIVYHFMFGPEWEEGCPSCSFLADHIDGALAHLNARDVT